MRVTIETVPNSQQRYKTLGDWTINQKGDILIRVSDLSDFRAEALVAIHELVEAVICSVKGITQEEVDRFDQNWSPPFEGIIEPGDDIDSPYYRPHQTASIVEQLVCQELGLTWFEYSNITKRIEDNEGL